MTKAKPNPRLIGNYEGSKKTIKKVKKEMLISQVEHAIKNELDSFETEFIMQNKRYIAEVIAERLLYDGFLTND